MIPIYKPYLSEKEQLYVNDCLSTSWISSRGKYIDQFEKSLAKYLEVENVITVSNGTVSLMLILAALDLPLNSEIITSSLTYVATASQACWLGYKIRLIDSDDFFQPSLDSFKKAINSNTKVLILPELYGICSNELNKFVEFCNQKNIILIEDSAEVFGGTFLSKKLGSFGFASSFSFFGNKTITTGEGGAICTNDFHFAERLRLLKSQSHIKNFVHEGPGFNFRMTNIQAAIGCAQLEKIDEIIDLKLKITNFYKKNLKYKIIDIPECTSTYWMPLFKCDENFKYDIFFNYLYKNNIDVRPCFTPIHLMPSWDKYISYVDAPNSEVLFKQAFNLPCFPSLTDNELDHIARVVNEF